MKYFVRTALFESGERLPVLHYTNTLEPVILSMRYVINERRETKKSGTIERDIRVIGFLYQWADLRKLDLESFLKEGNTFSPEQITSLCRYLRISRQINIKKADHEKDTVTYLSPLTFNNYLNVAKDFLKWAARNYISKKVTGGDIQAAIWEANDRIERSFSNNIVSGRNAQKEGLNKNEVESIRTAFNPQSSNNPFKPSLKFRNHIIFELLLATGIRRGELLKLKIRHLPQGPKKTLSVIRQPDSKDDPRRREPQVKTLEREIPLPAKLTKLLWEYVQNHRRKGRHQYLFTSHQQGSPMENSTVNSIFRLIRKKLFPETNFSPHTLRHTFNDNLVKTGISQGLTENEIRKMQKYLNGWSENSIMPELYTRKTIQADAFELMKDYQTELYEI
ncbi:MAG: tyrosine-type recombinase/integrase [Aridibacter sp.]